MHLPVKQELCTLSHFATIIHQSQLCLITADTVVYVGGIAADRLMMSTPNIMKILKCLILVLTDFCFLIPLVEITIHMACTFCES